MLGKDVVEDFVKYARYLGHIQIAGMPGRNELDSGVVVYTPIFQTLIELNYDRWIGCEYIPLGKTLDGLGSRTGWFT